MTHPKYEAAVLILHAYERHTEGDPRYDEPRGRELFLAWLRSDSDRAARWHRFADLYKVSDEEAIGIAVGLRDGDPNHDHQRWPLEPATRID